MKKTIATAKGAFNRKRKLFYRPVKKDLRKRLEKCYVWSVAIHGGDIWIRKKGERRIEALETWI